MSLKCILATLLFVSSLILVQSRVFSSFDSQVEFDIPQHGCHNFNEVREINKKVADILKNITHTSFFTKFRVPSNTDCPFNKVGGLDKNLIQTDELDNDTGIHYNWKENPEKYQLNQNKTKVWSAINQMVDTHNKDVSTFLKKLVSGIHTATNTHLSHSYAGMIDEKEHFKKYKLFMESIGRHPEYVTNLYYAYTIFLRAFQKRAGYLQKYNYWNESTQELISKANDIIGKVECSDVIPSFEENGSQFDATRYSQFFTEVSKVMNCFECERLRNHGKMQANGLATALRFLTSEPDRALKQNELVAFFATFSKLSRAMIIADSMFEMRSSHYVNILTVVAVGVAAMIVFLWIIKQMDEYLKTGFRKKFNMIGRYEKLSIGYEQAYQAAQKSKAAKKDDGAKKTD